MYVNYVNDKKQLGYKVVKDTNCGIELVLTTESTVLLIRNLSLNLKGKSKRIVVVISLATVVWFSNLESVSAIGLPMPPTPVVRVQPSYQHDSKVQIAKLIPRKKDLIVYKSPKEILFLMYLTDPRLSSNQELLKLVKELRGGSWGLIGTAAFLGLIILILSMGEGFQVPIVHPNGGVDRPANGGVHQQINHPKHGGRITVRMSESNQCPAHQTQVSGFVKNGKVDLRKCYDEVMRRSKSLHCENWSCEFERFKSLAMENGRVDENSAREAITVLNGEMLGFYRNAEREYYGKGVYGPDFKVIGQGEYSHVSHVEVKNPVGSDIEKAYCNGYSDIVKQGNKIGDKLSKQQSKWSNATFRASLSNLDPNASFPQSPANTLGLVDEFDVPISEKMIVQNAVENNCTNTSNVIFINNETNL